MDINEVPVIRVEGIKTIIEVVGKGQMTGEGIYFFTSQSICIEILRYIYYLQ